MVFHDRRAAGRQLADLLRHYQGLADVVVLALPRGGVPVAREVADALGAPMDLLLVRKLGVPGQEELAMGAIAGGDIVLNEDVARYVPPDVVERVVEREADELHRRDQAYRDGRPLPEVGGKTVIVVDDGLATGASMRAAVQALRQWLPKRIVVAVPVAPQSVCDTLMAEVDEVVVVLTPEPFGAVGRAYRDFGQVSDREVRRML